MKKFFVIQVLLCTYLCVNAQVVKIYKGSNVVASYTTEQMDSIVFTKEVVPEEDKGTQSEEESAIAQFIQQNNINVISEEQFASQGDSTSVEKNEYVLLKSSGVYMQIVNKGYGEKLPSTGSNNKAMVLTRFLEYNLLTKDTLTNMSLMYATYLEHIYVVNNAGTFTGIFNYSATQPSLMYSAYKSTAVPEGWLVPLRYVNIGYPSPIDGEITQVKLIVPSSQGQAYASAHYQPCYYELSLQKQR